MAINQAQLFDLLTEYRRENWRGIQTLEWQDRVVHSMAAYHEPAILKRIEPHWKLPQDAKILDLGSGVGNFVVACRTQGLRAFGVEPDRIGQGSSLTSLRIARQRLDSPAFAAAVGEQLPFADATFDLVVLDQVIEHVSDQSRVLAEAFRVLKPGGTMYVACPNYLRFYEPHYKIWFLPLMPKFLGALYLRLRSRDPVLLNQLKYTTNSRVRKLLKKVKPERLVDLNGEDLRGKFNLPGAAIASRKARFVKQLNRFPWLIDPVRSAAFFYVRLREGGCEMLAVKEA